MFPKLANVTRKSGRILTCLAVVLTVSACASNRPQVSSAEIFDPNEEQNRSIHEFNRSLDRTLFRPLSNSYGTVIPEDGRTLVSNFADNLSLPADIVNNVLQGDFPAAGNNSVRFLFNTIFGVAGLGDPASDFNIPRRKTDFGETLHVWGMGEGAYVELPVLGPSNERDTIGTMLDFTLDPVSFLLPAPEKYAGTAANVADRLGDRYDMRTTVDSILYDSADSYAQARIIYLQNRRFELGGTSDDAYLDVYDDPYFEFE